MKDYKITYWHNNSKNSYVVRAVLSASIAKAKFRKMLRKTQKHSAELLQVEEMVYKHKSEVLF